MRNFILVLASFLTSYTITAQMPGGAGARPGQGRPQVSGTFYGKLVDAKSSKPIEYASVQLIQNKLDSVSKKRKDVVIAGMLTDNHGDFRLENVPAFGQFKLQVSIVGFKPYEQTVSFGIKPGGDMAAMMAALDKVIAPLVAMGLDEDRGPRGGRDDRGGRGGDRGGRGGPRGPRR